MEFLIRKKFCLLVFISSHFSTVSLVKMRKSMLKTLKATYFSSWCSIQLAKQSVYGARHAAPALLFVSKSDVAYFLWFSGIRRGAQRVEL